jgi:carboxyl-terminal processing protease
MDSRRNAIGSALVLFAALVAGGWFLQQGIAQEEQAFTQSRLLQEVVGYISEQYVDEVDPEILYEYAVEGILERLGDPNTSLLGSDAYEDFRIQTQGDYGGVGLQILDRGGAITVIGPIPGSPGARAGIRPGDRVRQVDGQSTEGWSEEQAVQLLRGEPGSIVVLTVERPGMSEPIEFRLTRERIQLRSVPFAVLLEGDVGYVPLQMFSESSTEEMRASLDSLRDEGATSFILDLRANPGGVLDQGVGVTDLFLESGDAIVETRGKEQGPNGIFRATDDDRYEDMPVVVLVDRGSASASEIVAGALQDHDRALLIGNTTFGKGSVQSLFFGLAGGNTLKLTTARWYTPLGRSIERTEDDGELAEVEALDVHLPITINGQYLLPPDTAGRPTVVSEGGRTLYGGGGIVPDLLVDPDTLSSAEQAGVQAIMSEAGAYSTARFNFAVDYLADRPATAARVDLGEADLEAFYAELSSRAEGEIDRAQFMDAARFVELDLEAEVALQAGGDQGAFLQRLPYDAPVQQALELLRGAESPEELFSGAGEPLPEAGRAVSAVIP